MDDIVRVSLLFVRKLTLTIQTKEKIIFIIAIEVNFVSIYFCVIFSNLNLIS